MTRARTLSRLAHSDVLSVDSSNNVGVGSTIPDVKLDVIGDAEISGVITATSFSGALTGNTSGTAGGLTGSPNITINNLVGVAATFSGSVKIGGTAEANEIDEYEEGTWTPTFEGSTSGSGTLTNYGAWYTRIGRAVHFYCYIVCTGLGTISGNIKVAGLPFTVHATGGYQAVNFAAVEGLAITAGESLAGYCEINDDAFTLQLWDVTTGTSNLTSAELSADGGFVASGTYFA